MSDSSAASSSSNVLIVGAGPVGLTMAAHLRRHGLTCRVVDRSPHPSETSKALVLWGRTQEMLDDLGIVDDFLDAGRTLNAANLYGGNRPLARIPFEAEGTAYPKPLMLAQSETERLLTEHLRRVGVTVERPVELIRFADGGDHVDATLRHPDGRDEEVRCDWMLGCDGAHSTTRKGLGLEFTGEAEPNDWVLADCRVDGPVPQDELSLFWHTEGVLAFFPFAPNRCRIIADMGAAPGADRPPDPTLAEVQTVVDRRGPAGVRLSEPRWLAGFRIHERKVSEYQRGRVFLAGDAAHIHSPAGGQGMNTGMQDAYNLAWKLALVQAGRARPSPLLESYTRERSAVGAMVLRRASELTSVATLRNPLGQFVRNRLVRLLGHLAPFRRSFVRDLAELTVHYPHSPLNGESTGLGWGTGGIRPGDRLPDCRLRTPGTGEETRLLAELRGPYWRLLLLPEDSEPSRLAALHDVQRRADASYPGLIRGHLIVPGDSPEGGVEGPAAVWSDPEHAVRRALGARGTALALVRPDGYLGYRCQPASWDDLRAYLDRFLVAQPG